MSGTGEHEVTGIQERLEVQTGVGGIRLSRHSSTKINLDGFS